MKFTQIPYTRPELDEIQDRLKKLISAFQEAGNAAEQVGIFQEIANIQDEVSTASQLASIRHTIDTTDKHYESERNFYDQEMPKYSELTTEVYRSVSNSPYRKELEEEYGDQYFKIAELSAKTYKPEIVSDLQEENNLSSEYTRLLASAEIELDGETYNLSGIGPLTQDPDRDLRRRASAAREAFFAANAEQLDRIYDDMIKVRTRIARNLGYDNFIDLGYDRMLRTDYGPKEVAGYRENIRKHLVPKVLKYKEKQSKRIGIEDMKYYDLALSFLTGNPTPKGDPEWIIDNGTKMYQELSPETKEFFQYMLDNELMDLVNKKGKAGGGYCTYLASYKSPFIFSNFNGTSHDIDVLTHEAGHAFQVFSSRDQKLSEYFFPTYEACEIHSMSMEFFTWPWMDSFFKEDTEKYKFLHLEKSMSFLPYGVAVDEFQHVVYGNPDMTPKERNQAWREIEKKYLPWKDHDGNEYLESGGFWQRQAHIYKSPFYYIDYTLAQVCAFQFWIKMQEDFKGAWDDYLRLCKAGGSMSFLDLVDYADLRSPFEESTLKEVVDRIDDYLNSIDDTVL